MVGVKVRHTYRLRPSRTALRYLAREWGMCRFVWNELAAHSQHLHAVDPTATFGAAAQDRYLTHLRATTVDDDGVAWLAEGSSVAQQQIVRDFAAARTTALLELKNKVPARRRRGLPRFKKKQVALPSMNYTRRGFSLKSGRDGRVRLVLPGKISIPVVWSSALPADPSSVRVYRDSLGHWYASFVVDADHLEPVPAQQATAIGIDWGVTETATTVRVDLASGAVEETTAYDLPHAQHGRKAHAELAAAQRQMARRRRARGQSPSHGYRLAKYRAAKAAKKVARQRKDDARKWAKKIAADHQHIAVEDFRPKFLASTTMAAKAADAAIAATKAELVWQAAKHGRDLRLIHPAHTTTDCATCGARTKHRLPLGERTYTCATCGAVRPRDKNSAAVMVARAGFVPADAEDTRPDPAAALELAV